MSKLIVALVLILGLGIALIGCTATTTGSQIGFTYRTLSGEFVCAKHPSKSEWVVSKEAVALFKHLPPLNLPAALVNALSPEDRSLALRTYLENMENLGKAVSKVIVTESKPFPEPDVLVEKCRSVLRFID